MQIQNIISKINENSEKTEGVYVELSSVFPKLLSDSSVSSSNELMKIFQGIESFKNSDQNKNINVEELGVLYNKNIELLNKKIERLNQINENIN